MMTKITIYHSFPRVTNPVATPREEIKQKKNPSLIREILKNEDDMYILIHPRLVKTN